MAMTSRDILLILRLTLRQPRHAARVVIGWPLSMGERWGILALLALGSTLSAEVFVALAPEAADPAMTLVLANPVIFAALQFGGLVLMAGLIFGIGRQFGGSGSFVGGLAILGWMQAILLGLQLAQIVALVILPPLAVVIGLASLGLSLWLMPSFIAELHGFRSAFKTFLGMIGASVGLVVALSVVLVVVFGVGG